MRIFIKICVCFSLLILITGCCVAQMRPHTFKNIIDEIVAEETDLIKKPASIPIGYNPRSITNPHEVRKNYNVPLGQTQTNNNNNNGYPTRHESMYRSRQFPVSNQVSGQIDQSQQNQEESNFEEDWSEENYEKIGSMDVPNNEDYNQQQEFENQNQQFGPQQKIPQYNQPSSQYQQSNQQFNQQNQQFSQENSQYKSQKPKINQQIPKVSNQQSYGTQFEAQRASQQFENSYSPEKSVYAPTQFVDNSIGNMPVTPLVVKKPQTVQATVDPELYANILKLDSNRELQKYQKKRFSCVPPEVPIIIVIVGVLIAILVGILM